MTATPLAEPDGPVAPVAPVAPVGPAGPVAPVMPDTDPLKTAGPLHVKVPVAPTVEFPVTLKLPVFVIPVKD